MARREEKKSKGGIIFVLLLIIAAAVGVGVYFGTSGKTEKGKDNSKPSSKTEVVEEQEPEEEVTLLAYEGDNQYEKQILERYSNNNDYKVIRIDEGNCHGYLIAIYDASRVHVAASSKIGTVGEYVSKMSQDNNALVAINAGGFADENFNGDGGTPLGITVTKQNMIASDKYVNGNAGVIGLNSDNKLVLSKFSSSDIAPNGIRDCVSFGPYLIVNGERQDLTGYGALGPSSRSARTVIGQRADGIMLFLVVDGDRTKDEGATLGEVTNVMLNYGAVNASNLDGGTSCQMTVNHNMINDPTSLNGEHRSREVATCFYLESDGSDNGDKTAIK